MMNSKTIILLTSLLGPSVWAEQALFRGARKRQMLTTVKVIEDEGCPAPPSFSPNRFYEGFADCSMTKADMEMLDIESAAFRYITAQADRIRRDNYTSCFEKSLEGGRPYFYDNFAVHGVALLDLFQQLQLLPARCNDLHEPLREVLLSRMSVPLENVTVESLTSYTAQETPPIEWWEDEFLPAAANAFSCGFTSQDETSSPGKLPADIREAFLRQDPTIQRVWRLMKGYLRSPQKQRENANRQADFDVSLYVPFLKVPLARTYMGLEGSIGSSMRVGYPTYQGPAIWFLYHTIAARTAAFERQCNANVDKILSTFAIVIAYFGTTHPCPYCREHFMSRVSRNDRDWQTFGLENTLSPSQSESNLYPLEYLFAGGAGESDGSLRAKLASITDGNSLMLYLFKAHNAVTSSTTLNLNCRTSERADNDELFSCLQEGPKYGDNGVAGTGTMGRAWPTAKRYEFWLEKGDLWSTLRLNAELRNAYETLKDLDNQYGVELRQNYWSAGTEASPFMDLVGQEVVEATAALDAAMLALDVLYTEYDLSTPPQCDLAETSLAEFEPLAVPLPLMEDGNFRAPPPACIEYAKNNFKSGRRLQEDSFDTKDEECGSD
ncbi:expressed unknown protein [Seminavis robusta]|uniref:Sulfhydryl oxidase n=1 Tax=Seminavis robusta TaxID=568900 RepID=A0A9N8HIJ2_9STRA|nr:expressed unknown protein [Seminavis robusta]|eukprot:Sro625_g177650.1 n/a (608) ;mRNA; f:43733-45556